MEVLTTADVGSINAVLFCLLSLLLGESDGDCHGDEDILDRQSKQG